jgi:DNA-binding NarL/FixJ family response regulator
MDTIFLGMVEDDPWIAKNLESFFEHSEGIEVMINTDSMESFLALLPEQPSINMALIDIGLPGMSGIEGIPKIQAIQEDIDIVILSAHEEKDKIYTALCNGAVAYISKKSDIEKILDGLRIVKKGGSYMSPEIARKVVDHFVVKKSPQAAQLTRRQTEIVEALVNGLSYKMIAEELNISVETVRDHIKKIYRRLQINSKGELLRKRLDGEV